MRSRVIESLLPWQRVLLKIEVDLSTGCWNYKSPLNNKGYGQISWKDKGDRSGLAHRIIFEKFKGPIPKGRIVCHACDNPRCVNPEHLWLGSHALNMKDAYDKGRLGAGQFVLAAFDARKEKWRKYQREYQRERRRRKREAAI